MSKFVLHAIVSTAIAYPILSLLEYLIHRYLMHSPQLARALKSKYLWETFFQHAATHHHQCYDVFDHEDRPCGAVNIAVRPVTSLAAAALPCIIVLPIDALTSMILLMGAMINGVLWSKLHSEMHRPTNVWICRSSFFKYLHRLHFLHHRHPGANFNTLYLMWDWIFGTAARQTAADIAEMKIGTWRVRGSESSCAKG